MASWNLPPTIATGAPVPSTTVNNIINNEQFLYQRPYFSGYAQTATSLPNNTLTQIPMSVATTYETNYGMYLSGGLVVVPLTGIYFVSGQVYATGGSGTLDCTFDVNGNTGLISTRSSLTAGYTGVSASGIVSLAVNQYIGLYSTQTSGGPIPVVQSLSAMSIFFLGSL